MDLNSVQRRALRPDAQAFDEVRITTVPRYKMSGLSGDEWRISGKIQLLRKGRIVAEKGMRDVETCAQALPYFILESMDNGFGYFAGEDDFCDQEGCSEKATVIYKVKEEFSRDNPHEWHKPHTGLVTRQFCAKHSRRGDCGMDDSDANYELLEGKPGLPEEGDMSPSGCVQIKVDGIEQIPDAIRQTREGLRNNFGGIVT